MSKSWDAAAHAETFAIGLDVGQQVDFSALVVVSQVAHPGAFDPETETFHPERELAVRWLERPPLGTAFTSGINRAMALHNDPALLSREAADTGRGPRTPPIIMDATGVGLPLVEMFQKHHKVRPVSVIITGGAVVNSTAIGYRVPKQDLIAALSVEFELQRIKIASGLDLSDDLLGELRNFRMETNAATGRTRFDAAPGHHDDLLIAVSLAVWWLQEQRRHTIGTARIVGV